MEERPVPRAWKQLFLAHKIKARYAPPNSAADTTYLCNISSPLCCTSTWSAADLKEEVDRQRIFRALRQISQRNKGLIDTGGWQEDPKVAELLVEIADGALEIMHTSDL